MNHSDHYQTVSCAMHSELELAIMHGKHLMIYYQEPTSDFEEGTFEELSIEMKPHDVVTRGEVGKGEYLLGSENSGKPIEIRLDRINRFIIKD